MSSHLSRVNMVKQQLRTGTVVEEKILALYQRIDRSSFVPEGYQNFAYSDMQIPLAHGQRMMTPLEEGLLLQSLDLNGSETILEVGTGSGFLTALLSQLCKKVISIDYHAEFSKQAKSKLKAQNIENVTLHTADAYSGFYDQAPYDVIVMTGAISTISDSLRLQVIPGGKLFAIVGQGPTMQASCHTLSHDGVWQSQVVYQTQLPELINKLKAKDFIF